jgi:LysR family transcriptional activator of dmlA
MQCVAALYRLIHFPRIVNKTPNLADLRVFCAVARHASFSATAELLGVSPAFVSKRVAMLEADLGTRLLHRSTRRVTITEAGAQVFAWAEKILDDVEHLVEDVSTTQRTPSGTLRISSSFGFGRHVVAPAVARLSAAYPQLNVRLDLLDRIVDVAAEGFDLDVRIGDEIAPHLIARKLAANHRVLCASPEYLERHGKPRELADLVAHRCLVIKERDHPFGVWRLTVKGKETQLKVTGPLSTNHGEIAVQWSVSGYGIVLRSIWDVAPLLANGTLVQVLPQASQSANVWAVYPERRASSAKVRACVDFLVKEFKGWKGGAALHSAS